MTEQAVKDAKAKRDAAQADLDKAVKDTKDEIQKAADAVKDAAPDKAVKVVDPLEQPPAGKVEDPKPVSVVPSKPVPVHVASVVPSASGMPVALKVAIALAVAATVVAAVLHAKGAF